VGGNVIPAAGDHGLWPWRNVQSCDRDVAPHGREAGDHGLCPWGSIEKARLLRFSRNDHFLNRNLGLRRSWTFERKLNILNLNRNDGNMEEWKDGLKIK
jgi:hypothetical protein